MKHLTDHKTRVTAESNTKESSLPLKRQILKTAITVLTPGSVVLTSFTCSRNLLSFTDLLKFTAVFAGIPQLAQNISQINLLPFQSLIT